MSLLSFGIRKGAPLRAPFYFYSLPVLLAGLLGSASLVWAAPTPPAPVDHSGLQKTETYRDIIDKAQALSLQKERSHALQLLSSSIVRESKKGPAPRELVAALEEIAFLFLSDKAQQQYELALSLRPNEPQLALQRLNDAAKLEPDNVQIQLEQFRLGAILGNCGEAASSIQKLQMALPSLEALKLAAAQAFLCQGQFQGASEIRAGIDLKKNPLALFWQVFDAELLFRQSKLDKAQDVLVNLQKASPQFPETYYWQWRVEREQRRPGERPALKYVALCKSLSARSYRQYLQEPFLCRRLPEVESSLKKNNNPSA